MGCRRCQAVDDRQCRGLDPQSIVSRWPSRALIESFPAPPRRQVVAGALRGGNIFYRPRRLDVWLPLPNSRACHWRRARSACHGSRVARHVVVAGRTVTATLPTVGGGCGVTGGRRHPVAARRHDEDKHRGFVDRSESPIRRRRRRDPARAACVASNLEDHTRGLTVRDVVEEAVDRLSASAP